MAQKIILFFLFGIAGHVFSQSQPAIPLKGLQGYWNFSGNANDLSGNNRHGRLHGPVQVKDRFGNENSAYAFNGKGDYIETSYPGVLGNHARAVSFWAIVADSVTPYAAVAWGSNELFPTAGGRFDCGFNQKRAGLTVGIADAYITFESHDPVNDGKWHHYLFQFDKIYLKQVEVYQDGVLLTHEPSRIYPFARINTRAKVNVHFGIIKEITKHLTFKGQLDDIAIYDRALSQAEINELYLAPDPIKKQNILKWLYVFLAVLAVALLIYWIVRFSVKKIVAREKEKTRLKNQWYEQENRILQAQMDPHFIFNSLNTIQQFIIAEDNEKAQRYLSKFSRLVRMLLESNTNESISLKDEKELSEKYLEIESLRFNNVFDYEITFKGFDDLSKTYIPRFLVQPFIENAIWHGLLPKTGYKELDIVFEKLNDKTVACTIEDNGVGRKNSTVSTHPDSQGKTKRLGIGFVQQRLLNMGKIDGGDYFVRITDKTDAEGNSIGTSVLIHMPLNYQN